MMTSLLRAAASAGCSRRRRCYPGGFRPLSSSSRGEHDAPYFPVVVVGAGPTGATLAALLARLGVRSLLLEKEPVAGRAHPAAHFINARTMETFRRLPVVANGFGVEGEEEDATKTKTKPKTETKTLSVADAVAAACPPRDQWRRFVYCGSAVNGPLLASVDHFDEEERRERERKGRKGAGDWASEKGAEGGGGSALSPVRVAHLPQHRLLPLLLGAVELASRGDGGRGGEGNGRLVDARFGCEVSGIRPLAPSPPSPSSVPSSLPPPTIAVDFFHTASGRRRTAEAAFVVAADGARSPTREAVISAGASSSTSSSASRLGLSGTGPLQHLLSIHFVCPSAGRALLLSGEGEGKRGEKSKLTKAAMLYFVFNSGVAGAVVAHNLEKGEFVLQAPYFPPLQSASDFSKERIESLCRSALFGGAGAGGGRGAGGGVGDDLEVKAVRPWTMRARVAGAYHSKISNVKDSSLLSSPPNFFLAGDAAHEFPPAGGLGMNTGIADASALAWRLAAAVKGGKGGRGADGGNLLSSYSSERVPAARAAATLSLSNWRSTLAVPRSLGLDDRAAEAASKAAAAAAGFLPLLPGSRGAAAAALEGALSAGRAVFGSGGAFAAVDDIRASRAQGALAKTRGGLRLLFPAYDLGVGCSAAEGAAVLDEDAVGDDAENDDDDDGGRGRSQRPSSASWFPLDTPDPAPDAPYVPSTAPGSRIPHAWLRTAASASGGASTPPWLELPAASSSSSSSGRPPRRLSTLDLPPAREPSCVLIIRGGGSDPPSSPWSRAFLELLELARGNNEEGQAPLLPLRLAVVSSSDAAAEAACEGLRALYPDLAKQVAFLVDEEGEGQGWISDEAVLVRADGIVGWRASTKPTKAKAATTTGKGSFETEASCSSSLLRALRRVYGFSGEPGDAPLPPWEQKTAN